MRLNKAEKYHFANVTGIDISGEVLPQHPNRWQVNRGEDLAFLLEACGERLAIKEKIKDYIWRHPPSIMTTSEAEAIVKNDYMRGQVWNRPLVLADAFQEWTMLDELNESVLGDPSRGNGWWCSGIPEMKEWSAEDFPGWDPCDLFPEMYPSALAPILPSRNDMPLPWTVDLQRAAYADLTARQFCLVPETAWFNNETQVSRRISSGSGGSETEIVSGWKAECEYIPSQEGEPTIVKCIPDQVDVGLSALPPEIARYGKVVTVWKAIAEGEGEHYYMSVKDPGHSFEEELEDYMPTSGNGSRYLKGTMIGYIVQATEMRTYLSRAEVHGFSA